MNKSCDDNLKISVYMITFNNERTVEAALKSLQWADEIIVVDSFSSDKTPEIAQKYASKFEQRPWPGFRDQYQYASELCTHRWLLFVDADEVIPKELAIEMPAELAINAKRSDDEKNVAYTCQRRTWYLGRWIEHGNWVPDREIRLYNRQKGSWKGGLHAKVHVDGKVAEFANVYRHYTYADLSDHLQTIDRYSETAAQELIDAGKKFSYSKLVFSPLARFTKSYVLKSGYRDGFPGFVVAVNSFYDAFIKYAKVWELEKIKKKGKNL